MTHLPGMELAGRVLPATDRGPPGAVAGGGGEPRGVPAGVGRTWSAAVRGSPPDAPSALVTLSLRRPTRTGAIGLGSGCPDRARYRLRSTRRAPPPPGPRPPAQARPRARPPCGPGPTGRTAGTDAAGPPPRAPTPGPRPPLRGRRARVAPPPVCPTGCTSGRCPAARRAVRRTGPGEPPPGAAHRSTVRTRGPPSAGDPTRPAAGPGPTPPGRCVRHRA